MARTVAVVQSGTRDPAGKVRIFQNPDATNGIKILSAHGKHLQIRSTAATVNVNLNARAGGRNGANVFIPLSIPGGGTFDLHINMAHFAGWFDAIDSLWLDGDLSIDFPNHSGTSFSGALYSVVEI